MRRDLLGTAMTCGLAAALVLAGAHAACATASPADGSGVHDIVGSRAIAIFDLSEIADTLAAGLERLIMFARAAEAWALLTLEKAPALAIGLAATLAMLPLTLLGLVTQRLRYSEMTLALRRGRTARARTSEADGHSGVATGLGWPADAWVEFTSPLSGHHWIGRRMVRIGRDEDNDIQLTVGTVHRHHAVIHHTDDAEFMIKDLSSADGNGVLVNGRRVGEARLRHGDTVALGEAVMTFRLKPA